MKCEIQQIAPVGIGIVIRSEADTPVHTVLLLCYETQSTYVSGAQVRPGIAVTNDTMLTTMKFQDLVQQAFFKNMCKSTMQVGPL